MDGVGKLTQCSIQPSTSFTYIFNASQYGTHWYHSHNGFQRSDGLYGALIIKQQESDFNAAKIRLKEHNITSFNDFPDEHTLLFSDWLKANPLERSQKHAVVFKHTYTLTGFLHLRQKNYRLIIHLMVVV